LAHAGLSIAEILCIILKKQDYVQVTKRNSAMNVGLTRRLFRIPSGSGFKLTFFF
jgi:hypothetical protein